MLVLQVAQELLHKAIHQVEEDSHLVAEEEVPSVEASVEEAVHVKKYKDYLYDNLFLWYNYYV